MNKIKALLKLCVFAILFPLLLIEFEWQAVEMWKDLYNQFKEAA